MANALEAIEPREATNERWNVYVVADYGVGDAAFAEVASRLRAQHGGFSAEKIAVPPFSTIATGFWIRQLGIEDAYPEWSSFQIPHRVELPRLSAGKETNARDFFLPCLIQMCR